MVRNLLLQPEPRPEAGEPQAGNWNDAKKKLDKIEAAAEASVQQAIAAIDKPR